MRLAELSDRSGLSTATIKYYLRTGLLRSGARRSTTWAEYDETHLRRLRLIRALTDVAGLSLEEVRRTVEEIDSAESGHDARGAAQWPLAPTAAREPSSGALDRVDGLLTRHRWSVHADSPHRRVLAIALDTLNDLGLPAPDDLLDRYVTSLWPVAELEVSRVVEESDPAAAAELLVVGTLLYEPVLLMLRRLAHEAVSTGLQERRTRA